MSSFLPQAPKLADELVSHIADTTIPPLPPPSPIQLVKLERVENFMPCHWRGTTRSGNGFYAVLWWDYVAFCAANEFQGVFPLGNKNTVFITNDELLQVLRPYFLAVNGVSGLNPTEEWLVSKVAEAVNERMSLA